MEYIPDIPEGIIVRSSYTINQTEDSICIILIIKHDKKYSLLHTHKNTMYYIWRIEDYMKDRSRDEAFDEFNRELNSALSSLYYPINLEDYGIVNPESTHRDFSLGI